MEGIDGSEILTHFITTPVPGGGSWTEKSNWFYTYNGLLTPETVLGVYRSYQNKALNQHLLISYGHGDGGGGVTREMLENRRKMAEIPGLPMLKTGRAADFLKSYMKLSTKIRTIYQSGMGNCIWSTIAVPILRRPLSRK